MDDAGNVTQDGEEDVDEEVRIATALKEDTERRDEDGEDDLDNVAVRARSQYVMSSPNRDVRRITNLPVKAMSTD